jgi:hypothetical protein
MDICGVCRGMWTKRPESSASRRPRLLRSSHTKGFGTFLVWCEMAPQPLSQTLLTIVMVPMCSRLSSLSLS